MENGFINLSLDEFLICDALILPLITVEYIFFMSSSSYFGWNLFYGLVFIVFSLSLIVGSVLFSRMFFLSTLLSLNLLIPTVLLDFSMRRAKDYVLAGDGELLMLVCEPYFFFV
mgnify:CR=1 FL=1